ncbi:hypothetical protein LPJ78_000718 [Coemansia sp. RSA 989]|nr:hypothetical protein LPJ79_001016 [Coemansia sp. RSA 1821]KAJ1867846.1 hypothetical protein LPJ78_000718 [Coemansia sp. RSA 989]KAJ2673729.1 hypothetical protein IWW42_002141 [Coemansia sp. RSA 1085]
MAEARTIFIVMRKDLVKVLQWPLGSVVSQGAHAAVAVMHKYRDDERVKEYVQDLDSMHKVVLETKNETSLLKMADNLRLKNIPFYLWTEQPENIPTCLATVPIMRSDLGDALKKLSEWSEVTDRDIVRVLRVFNNQFAFEYSIVALERVERIINICIERKLPISAVTFYNEWIRLHVARKNYHEAYRIKRNILSGTYGSEIKPDIYTYAALFNDPSAATSQDMARLIRDYEEMLDQGIEPNELQVKPLIRLAIKSGEFKLLEELLDSASIKPMKGIHSNTEARLLSTKARGYIALFDLDGAKQQIEKLLLSHISQKSMPLPWSPGYESGVAEIKVPLEHTQTREAFFVYVRSLYESVIRIHIIRRMIDEAYELMEEMRRTIYLPPTRMAYNWFIRYHSKRKQISKLHEIQDMMLQDGVAPDEYAYTKFINACMFQPKSRLLQKLIITAFNQGNVGPKPDQVATQTNADDTHVASKIENDPELYKAGLPAVPQHVVEFSSVHKIVFHPHDCLRFYNALFTESKGRIGNVNDIPIYYNVHIVNAVMRAYALLEKPKLVVREFYRYAYHQARQCPQGIPPEVPMNRKHLGHVFRMALEASSAIESPKQTDRIHSLMNQWQVWLPWQFDEAQPSEPN